MRKICNTCHKEQDISKFYSNGKYKNRTKYKPYCKVCEVQLKRLARFNALIEALGKLPTCEKCGYNANIAALDFHHIDPEEKEYGISHLLIQGNFKELKRELEKCIILCATCHRELHNPSSFINTLLRFGEAATMVE